MLRFDKYKAGKPAGDINLSGAYVFAQDDIPIRADLVASGNRITCRKRMPGSCGLALLWNAGPAGRYLLSTTRLPERRRPYNLNIEMARAQIMRLYRKREDWGLFDHPGADGLNGEFDRARKMFVEAIKADITDPPAAAVLADKSLAASLVLGEKTAVFHANALNVKRVAAGGKRLPVGCGVRLGVNNETCQSRLKEGFDFINLPMPWRYIESAERVYEFARIDAWCNWAAREARPIHAGPLISFEPDSLPDWLFIWRGDFKTLRRLILEHVRRVVGRYSQRIRLWNVVSSLNAVNPLDLSFDEITELTARCCQLVKGLAPHAQIMIDLTMPFGEYYARNRRTIPPLLYADMAYQSDMKFDAFGLSLQMGIPVDGYYVRDLMQISSLLDDFLPQGKRLHLTACGVPSAGVGDGQEAEATAQAGRWHGQWSPQLQTEWLRAVFRLANSKPFIDSICWEDLADWPGQRIPNSGLCGADFQPKSSYQELRNLQVPPQPRAKAESKEPSDPAP